MQDNPFTMPHRSREGELKNQRAEKEARWSGERPEHWGRTIEENYRCTQKSSGSSFLPTAKRFSSTNAQRSSVNLMQNEIVIKGII